MVPVQRNHPRSDGRQVRPRESLILFFLATLWWPLIGL
jgi:hypothetical protein